MSENCSSSSTARPTRRLAAELVQLAEHHEVLATRQQRVDGGVLGGEADAPAHLAGVRGDVEPGDGRRPRSGVCQRREDPYRSGLAGAVGTEHSSDGPGAYLDVDAGKRGVVAVVLDEPAGDDGVPDVEIGGDRCREDGSSFVDEFGHGSPPDGARRARST